MRAKRLNMTTCIVFVLAVLALPGGGVAAGDAPRTNGSIGEVGATGGLSALFGDLHIHSGFSLDAFAFGVTASADDAYRYARGQPIRHASGEPIRIGRPLDFIAVTDHAEYLGVFASMRDEGNPLSRLPLARNLYSHDANQVKSGIEAIKRAVFSGQPMRELLEPRIVTAMWKRVVELADRYYEPGEFTAFVGFEWSATPGGANLHRNVIFVGGSGAVPATPFSAIDSTEPESLWNYLEAARARYGDVIAIPHNPNLSDGLMFPDPERWPPELAERRQRNEPVVEISQIKGTSETHPLLSPEDEWSSFELLGELMGQGPPKMGIVQGSYARDALKRGLRYSVRDGVNPYRFGFVAASDSHNASSPVEESNYTGKIGRADASAVDRRDGASITSSNLKYSASGLTGVWARANTREAIFAALKRREVFATSGSRIRLRFEAAWLDRHEQSRLKARVRDVEFHDPVPMGGILRRDGSGRSPVFRLWAGRDPDSASLQRVQLVKGWLRDGQLHETVRDLVCASGQQPDPVAIRCPEESAELSVTDCGQRNDGGARQLQAVWVDPDFDVSEPAFYYIRVLENPSCRWSTWDAIRNGWSPPEGVAAWIQERAWSSPIWYEP